MCADVAVLVPAEKKVVSSDPIRYPYSFGLGQEAYFLGFPYGLYSSVGKGAVPLVKHAYVSAVVNCDAVVPGGSPDEGLLLLDGLNNPGFSGGPVVAPDVYSPGPRILKVIGVVSGFRNEYINVNVNGKVAMNAAVPVNTGIVVATTFERVTAMLKLYTESGKNGSGAKK